jgi:hypothetical protein
MNNGTFLNEWFHALADEGKEITSLKKEYSKSGKNLSSARVETLVKLKKLKRFFNSKD